LIDKANSELFKVALPEYLSYGGGGFIDFSKHQSFKIELMKDAEALSQYLEAKKSLNPNDYIHQSYNICNSHF
jgi:hypothetical protein